MARGVKTGGRQKGTPNKATGALKDAILLAAEETGIDGEGTDGLRGYLRRVAKDDVKAFCSLLGKVLPAQIQADLTFHHEDALDELDDEPREANPEEAEG